MCVRGGGGGGGITLYTPSARSPWNVFAFSRASCWGFLRNFARPVSSGGLSKYVADATTSTSFVSAADISAVSVCEFNHQGSKPVPMKQGNTCCNRLKRRCHRATTGRALATMLKTLGVVSGANLDQHPDRPELSHLGHTNTRAHTLSIKLYIPQRKGQLWSTQRDG